MAGLLTIALDPSQSIEYVVNKKDRVEIALMQRLDRSNEILLERIRTNLGGKVLNIRSGALFGSAARTPAVRSGDSIVGDVHAGGESAKYGIFHEMGGKGPYVIRPTVRQALMFEMDGKAIFARLVHHPTIQQRPWFKPAVDETKPEIQPALQSSINEVLSE